MNVDQAWLASVIRRNGVERLCEFFLALRTVISLAGMSHLTPETVQVEVSPRIG
jgi:hypothetical protein